MDRTHKGGEPTEPSAPPTWVINGGIVVLSLIWGSTWLVIRQGLTDLPPLTSAATRFVLAGAILASIAPKLARLEGGARPSFKLVMAYAVLTLAVPYGVIYEVETILPSGLVSILWSVYPLILACCAHVFLPDERLGVRQWCGLFAGFGGILLLFATEVQALGPGALPAGLCLLFSPALCAVGNTVIKRCGRSTSSVLLNRNGNLFGALLLVVSAVALEHDQERSWSTQAIGSILYLALVGSVLAFSLYYWLLRYAPATRLSLLVYGIPLVAVSLGVTLGEEKAGPNTFLGMAAILAGVFLVLTPRTRKSSG
jgi:drug/metabolite transporter (DMT)-like permease